MKEIVSPADYYGIECMRKPELRPRSRGMARSDLYERLVPAERTLDQKLHAPAGFLQAAKPCLHHAGVVEDEHITRSEELRQILKDMIGHRAIHEPQQATPRALGRRVLRH